MEKMNVAYQDWAMATNEKGGKGGPLCRKKSQAGVASTFLSKCSNALYTFIMIQLLSFETVKATFTMI